MYMCVYLFYIFFVGALQNNKIKKVILYNNIKKVYKKKCFTVFIFSLYNEIVKNDKAPHKKGGQKLKGQKVEKMKELVKALRKETKERIERSKKAFDELKTLEEKETYISRFYYNKSLSRFYKKENAQTKKQKEKALLKIIKLEKLANQQAGLETIERLKALKGEKVRKVRICVEWHSSRVWGANPSATVEVFSIKNYEFKRGYASGCGYDKESASIAQALNQCDHIKALLYRAKEKALRNGEALPYGLGNYSALPHYEGGVGVSCFLHFFESLGAKVESVHGKSSSFYYIDFEQGKGAR